MRIRRTSSFVILGSSFLLAAACGGSGDASTSTDPIAPGGGPNGASSSSGGAASSSGGASSSSGSSGASSSSSGSSGDPEPAPVPYVHFDVNHVLSTGQSNSVANGGTPVLSTSQPYANLMFDSGVIPGTVCDASGCKAYAKPNALVPLVEGDKFFSWAVETMSSGLANEVSKIADAKGFDPAHAVLVSLHGRSGNTYWCLRKGGCNFKGPDQGYLPAFTEAMMEVTDAMALAKAQGKSYVVRAVTAIHGESDHYGYSLHQQEFPLPATDGNGQIADYGQGMLEWQRDYEAGVKEITGQTQPVPLFISQMDNWTDRPHSEVMQWQYEAHVKSKGKVVLVTAGYPMTWASDCLHFNAAGQRRLGEYFAKAYARVVIEGRTWEPVHPKSVKLVGSTITAQYFVPKPPLVIDTERVSDPGNYGFEVVDANGTNVAISAVAVTSPDTVTITLAAPAGPGLHLRYAFTESSSACPGPMTGPRGNLRDSDDTPSQAGYELFNWGVHFDVAVQ